MIGGKVQYDYKFMSADNVGRFGFKQSELVKIAKNLPSFNKKIRQEHNQPKDISRKGSIEYRKGVI